MLATLLERYRHLPAQRSAQWYKNRLTSIGGSELATLLGLNKYQTIEKFLTSKIYSEREDNNNFKWGILFEPVHTIIMENRVNATIYDIGSVPWKDDSTGYRTSPDGLFETNLGELMARLPLTSSDIDLSTIDPNKKDIFVLELKAPIGRALTPTVPEMYIPQLESEMCIIPEVSYALFSECIFKRCTMQQFNIGNREFVKSASFFTNDKYIGGQPLINGLIYIQTNENTSEDLYRHYTKSSEFTRYDGVVDFGTVSIDDFYLLIDCITNRELTPIYTFNNETCKFDKEYVGESTSKFAHTIGVIPWKVYDISYHLMTKNPTYIEDNWPIISKTLDTIHTLQKELENYSVDDINENGRIDSIDYQIASAAKLIKKLR